VGMIGNAIQLHSQFNLKLKTWHKQILGSHLLAFVLLKTQTALLFKHNSRVSVTEKNVL
jgi:hypothetical protein